MSFGAAFMQALFPSQTSEVGDDGLTYFVETYETSAGEEPSLLHRVFTAIYHQAPERFQNGGDSGSYQDMLLPE